MTVDQFDALVRKLPQEVRHDVAGASYHLRAGLNAGVNPWLARYQTASVRRYFDALLQADLLDEFATVGGDGVPVPVTPVLHRVIPDVGKAGTDDVDIRYLGAGFTPESVTVFNGGDDTSTFETENTIGSTVSVSGESFEPMPGTYAVYVRNDDARSDVATFTILPRDA